ncbi:dihydrofolate reductase family protein [Actinoplanes aureus]|uniref:Dihydrofolate reductase family protein n=1 Tax=Actinoplanes aureus TaxID=2792083 RepID=A0A931FZQ0_9ACTN|nr:dihydrofolate reductase family protein [Actinoplanes aureus]MBG0565903.1 dihydrofolate reductase family protein [Actinoplanes aureus]
MRPRVVIHNSVSVDGRLTGFPVDLGLHYEIAARIPADAILSGSGTMLAAAAEQGVDLSGEDPPPSPPADGDQRPLLVIVDGRGRLTRLDWLRAVPHWRDVVIMCCAATPHEHRARRVVTAGDRVDLAAGLAQLHAGYGVRTVKVDAGGTLNARLLDAGLVDEVSVIVSPRVAAGETVPLFTAAAGTRLRLAGSERLRDDHLWLRYTVSADTAAG